MNSADRLLGVLGLFSEERPEWTAEQMMKETGFTRPTLYRYLKSLRETGLVTSVSGSAFSLGPRVTELDYLMRKADPLIAHGQSALEELTARSQCSAFLVRWYGRKILCVSSLISARAPVTSYPRGRPMPLARPHRRCGNGARLVSKPGVHPRRWSRRNANSAETLFGSFVI